LSLTHYWQSDINGQVSYKYESISMTYPEDKMCIIAKNAFVIAMGFAFFVFYII